MILYFIDIREIKILDKKIMIICHGIGNGGAQRVTTILANGFNKKGYQIRLVTMAKEEQIYHIEDNIDYVPIQADQKIKMVRVLYRIFKLKELMRQFEPTYVISLSAIPNLMSIIARGFKKYSLIISERTDPSKHPAEWYAVLLRNILYRIPNAIVFQTEDAKNWFHNDIKKKGVIIPNPVTNTLPLPFEGIRSKKIVGVGSLVEQKDWLTSIKAFEILIKEYPEYQLIIYGDGNQRNQLEEYIDRNSELKQRVNLPGFEENIHEKILDSFLFISSAEYDGISNSILEALALGLPSICTDCPVGGARMMITNEINGLLVEVGDVKGLYKAMKRLIIDAPLANQLSKEAVNIRKEYAVENIIERWEQVLLNCGENKC